MFTIRVISSSTGKPARSVSVSVSFDGFFGGVTKSVYTDDEGEAEFDYNPGSGKIYVNEGGFMAISQEVYHGPIQGRKTVYIR